MSGLFIRGLGNTARNWLDSLHTLTVSALITGSAMGAIALLVAPSCAREYREKEEMRQAQLETMKAQRAAAEAIVMALGNTPNDKVSVLQEASNLTQ